MAGMRDDDDGKAFGRVRLGADEVRALLALCEAAEGMRIVVEARVGSEVQKGGIYAYVAADGRDTSVRIGGDVEDVTFDVGREADGRELLSTLVASGMVDTSAEAHWWVTRAAAAVRREVPQVEEVLVWPYRQGPDATECLSATFGGTEKVVEVTLRAQGWHDGRVLEASVPDMVEAVHMVGLLICELGIKNVAIGRKEG